MKKFTLTLSLSFLGAFTAFAADWDLQGSGTQTDPYQISSASDFVKIAEKISATNTGAGEYFKLMNDIDFGGSEIYPVQLPAIGKAAITSVSAVAWGFEGALDGDSHEVKGIYHNNNANNKEGQFNALFSSLGENGVIKNLIFGKDNYVNAYNYVAPFVSISKGTIENCTNNADITATNAFASGICGQMIGGKGTISSCTNNGNISAMTYAVGIIAGTQSGAAVSNYAYLVEDCVNNGTMSTLNDLGVAGIAGSYSGSLIDCTNNGDINGNANGKSAAQYAAGVVASVSYPVEISRCVNNGKVRGVKNAGGIIAMVMAGDKSAFAITDCKNYGKVSASGEYVAGIIANTMRGSVENQLVSVSDCYNGAEISSTSDTSFIGNIRGTEDIAIGEGNSIEEGLERYELDGNISGVDNNFKDGGYSQKNGKYIIDGEIIIMHNGKSFNLQGMELRK